MRTPSLKTSILIALGVGALGILYVIFSAFVTSARGPLDTYAVGEMREFRTTDGAPGQPRTPLVTDTGEEITLADKRGKILLVNFWATWCAPCVVEMPYLDTLQARYGSREFEVVAVSMDRTLDDARRFYDEHGLDHLALYHDVSFNAAFAAGARGLPTTILYDRNGVELGRLDGEAAWASEEAFALIEAVLERY